MPTAQWVALAASTPMQIRMGPPPLSFRTACPLSPASPYTAIEGIA
jgi:hypothetical protein